VKVQSVAAPAALHWSDPWLRWRDRLLASPRFRRWAEGFWPARWIARRRAGQLFDLLAGFVYSQVLLACVRLGLFERLSRDGPKTLSQLAAVLPLPEPALDRLLQAACALRLLERRPLSRFGLGPLGAPLVGNSGLVAMIEHHEALYRDLVDPLALLRAPPGQGSGGALSGFWPYARAAEPAQLGAQQVAAYSKLMATSVPWVAEQLLQAYPLQRHQRLLDVGGGEGAFAACVARALPALQVQVFDLPEVAKRATSRFIREGLADRCAAAGGDFLRDALPAGFDAISLVRVLHDHDEPAVLRLLAAAHRALPVGGRLLIAEPLADAPGTPAMGDAYFGLYLWAMGSGQARSRAQLAKLLERSGFEDVRALPTAMPLHSGLIVATRGDSSSIHRSSDPV
jgi:demethylspheroidene O-methyltransferase